MTKFSPEYLSLADDLRRQYALTGDEGLSDILTSEDLVTVIHHTIQE
ncbi:hypothetical protein NX722_17675 [Endozoicomonas gorgoniicola]|uniref:Uncharacterized protein n=1 Tax=Endozoicomonas gorgoniicola TaxID=1234144 RepID=A0ABT3MYF7_9GAMM|nr:hypothetical protein [Endozoicomonas gorgoniicola]MCW7554417.1 hypothetical protein [Endozoicomonas gorgoniicola]